MPDVTLRDYQVRAVEELRAAVVRHGSAVYCLPTGGGKMIVAASIAKGAFGLGNRTLMLVHRRELVRQAVATLEEALPSVSVGVEAPGWPSQPWAALQVAMIQSIHRRKNVSINPALIMIDEAHHVRAATWEKVLARWPDVPRIGFTATPERLDGKGLDQHFKALVMGPSVQELVAQDALAPTIVRRIPQEAYQDEDARAASAVDAYMDYALGKKAIFFGEDIAHSESVCAALRERGVRAEHVDGKDSAARRDRVMLEFKTGGLDVIGNCSLFSEGVDAPACEVVIMGKRTTSVVEYLQEAGRAMRYLLGKTAEILDVVGNSFELGLPDDTREWSLSGGHIRDLDAGGGKAADHVCQICKTVYRGGACPACGHVPIALPLDRDEERMELEVASRGAPKVKRKRKGPRLKRTEYNKLLYGARRAPDPIAALHEIAERNGYKEGWVKHVARGMGIITAEEGV